MLAEVKKILEGYALNVISAARNNLSKTDNSNGDLANSLISLVTEEADGSILVNFLGEDYATFYDQGVQGAAPDRMPPNSLARYNKAPLSPYHFGTGSSKGKGSLRGAIDKWVIKKGLDNTRNNLGQFIPRKSMVFLISRSIYLTGLKPSLFFTTPFDFYTRQLEDKLEEALERDIELNISQGNQTNEITINVI